MSDDPTTGETPATTAVESPTDTPTPPGQHEGEQPQDVSGLQSALEKERTLRKAAEKAAKEGERHRARVEELEAATQSDTERAVAQARKEAAAEARQGSDARLVRAEARALAAEARFRDPSRIVKLLDGLDEITIADDGTVDTDAIRKQLDELATEAPYLVTVEAPPTPRPPAPNPAQGATAPVRNNGQGGVAEAERRFGKRAGTAATH